MEPLFLILSYYLYLWRIKITQKHEMLTKNHDANTEIPHLGYGSPLKGQGFTYVSSRTTKGRKEVMYKYGRIEVK